MSTLSPPWRRRLLAAMTLAALTALAAPAAGAPGREIERLVGPFPEPSVVRVASGDVIEIFLELSQVDYSLDGVVVVPDSEWGQLDVLYDAAELVQVVFLNIVANPVSTEPVWIVQNHPLTPSADPEDCCFRSAGYFDLASAFQAERGIDLGGRELPILVTVTEQALTGPPGIGEQLTATIALAPAHALTNSGVPSEVVALNPPLAEPVPWIGLNRLRVRTRNNMPNVVQEENFCGPGSAANSLHWLDAENAEITIDDTLEETQDELAEAMGNDNDGNWDDAQVEGKLEYIDDHDLPIEVHYTGGEMLPTDSDYESPDGHGTARNDGPVTWAWIKREMDRGQDIEIMTETHWVVLDGYIDLGGVHLLRYRDDPYQHGDATTEEEEEEIEGRHVWTYFDSDGNTNIGNGEEELLAAVAESPIEEEPPEIPPPPSDQWLVTSEQPGFEFQARITPAGGAPIVASAEPACIIESLCVSGALAGRPEVFVKLIGPRPNGFLWTQISRFTPSEVEVWVHKTDTGQVNYYRLPPVGPGADEVCGLQDRQAFSP